MTVIELETSKNPKNGYFNVLTEERKNPAEKGISHHYYASLPAIQQNAIVA
jgi:hypothetical protein